MPTALLILVLSCGILTSPAVAQEARSGPAGGVTNLFDHYVVGGGWITWFVLIPLSVATAALAVEHALSIRRATLLPDATVDQITDFLEQRRYAEALEFTADDESFIAQVIHGGLSHASHGYATMERAMEDALEGGASRLMRKIEYLNIIGNVSPMIGLFGTVVGIIRLFASIGNFSGNLDAGEIAASLSIALVATYWGLLIAIPALSVFALFRNRIETLTTECAAIADRMMLVFRPGGPNAGEGLPAVQREVRPRRSAVEVEAAVPLPAGPRGEER